LFKQRIQSSFVVEYRPAHSGQNDSPFSFFLLVCLGLIALVLVGSLDAKIFLAALVLTAAFSDSITSLIGVSVSTADVLFFLPLFAFGAVRGPAFGKGRSSSIIEAVEEEELAEEIEEGVQYLPAKLVLRIILIFFAIKNNVIYRGKTKKGGILLP
jgi:hypothetical protein